MEWMGDTPQTAMTTRAPAVLKSVENSEEEKIRIKNENQNHDKVRS